MRPAKIRQGSLVLSLLLSLAALPASAVTVVWNVDQPSSPLSISLHLEIPLLGTTFTGTGDTSAGGTVDSDVAEPLEPSPSLQFTGASLTFADTTFMTDDILGTGAVVVTTSGIGGTWTGGPASGAPPGSGPWTVDLAGFVVTLDAGTITATHPLLSQTFDLSMTPLVLVLPTTLATLTAFPLGGSLYDLSVVVPVAGIVNLDPLVPLPGVTVNPSVELVGTISMGATATLVPEPGTALLAAAGLVGLAALGRRSGA
jgi:hypothetical protein